MTPPHQKPTQPHRTPQPPPALARIEVCAPEPDRALLLALARRLTAVGPVAAHARATLERLLTTLPPTDGILAALRRSPMVDAGLDLSRPRIQGRDSDL